MGKSSPEADTIICPGADIQVLLKLIKNVEIVEAKKCGPISTLFDSQRVEGCSNV